MPTNTLTSLAILKVNIDQGNNYLDYIVPFILQVLVEHKPDPVTDRVVGEYIRNQFGLMIPDRTVQMTLQRICRKYSVRRDSGVFRIVGDLPDPQLGPKQASADLHIGAVLHGLREFSQATINPIDSEEEAVASVSAFLSEFDITCLRAYLRGTAIPTLEGTHQSDIVLVSQYVYHIQQTDPERFKSFLVLVQGHMLANALMCPDLENAPSDYRRVTFYLDTPLLVQILGLEGEAKEVAACELIAQLTKLKGKIAMFGHSRQELEGVIRGAAANLESSDWRGEIISEARRCGTTRSDLLLLAESVDDKLSDAGIEEHATPHYTDEYQIDEVLFEAALVGRIGYRNPNAKAYDINSVRSIYAIRANRPARSIEKAHAVLVTSNTSFAIAALKYGGEHHSLQDESSVITDFSLANIAWLKAPIGGPNIPRTQLLAFSYAALQPSAALLDRYMTEIDRLEEQGTITERDHQLLRTSTKVYPELMNLTLGEDASLTAETVTETLRRVSTEIKREETEKLTAEQKSHQETLDKLIAQRSWNDEVARNLYWRCRDRARLLAWILSGLVALVIAIGLLAGLGLRSTAPVASWVLVGSSAIMALLTLGNLVVGSNVKDIHMRVQNKSLTWLLKREAKSLGIDISEFEMDQTDAFNPGNRVEG